MKASLASYTLDFNFLARTSREELRRKTTYFIRLDDDGMYGVGECALFRGLSYDDKPEYEDKLRDVCNRINSGSKPGDLSQWPSIRFGYESALADLSAKSSPTGWDLGREKIRINGLIWMDTVDNMLSAIEKKLARGFRCIKLKIGGRDFNDELRMLKAIRREFDSRTIEIRLDANGAFSPSEALKKIDMLSQFDVHSIEQPIAAGQTEAMARLCEISPIDIALDEELIGVNTIEVKRRLVKTVRPKYLILKPTLCGGLTGADEWIEVAVENNVGWWATSALESNVGLNSIARWLSKYSPLSMPQGLGTGQIYSNNIPSPLALEGEWLKADSTIQFNYDCLRWR